MSYNSDDDGDYVLLIPEVDDSDVEQEIAVLKLTHPKKKYRKDLVRKRLENKVRRVSLFFDISANIEVSPVFFEDNNPEPPVEVISQLLTWCYTQPPSIQNIIYEFLEEPDSDKIEDILKAITTVTHERYSVEKTSGQSGSLAQLILRSISADKNSPTPIEGLFEIARTSHISTRPEAAVRQTIRTYLSRKIIFQPDPEVRAYYRKPNK